MPDLTIIYLTAEKLPGLFSSYVRDVLSDVIGDYPLISVSRTPLKFGRNIIDTAPPSHLNMYKQLLRACKLAGTPYIATAEDDVLYSKEHFNFYRPPLDTIVYDMSRWSLFTWGEPIYSVKQRISNCTLIAPREEYIDALEEKLNKLHESNPYYVSEVGRYERQLGLIPRKIEKVYAEVPCIQVNHLNGTDPLQKDTRKRLGQLKAYDIPHWGKASDIVKKYMGEEDG